LPKLQPNAIWDISNKVIHADLKVPRVGEEITKFNVKYRDKMTTHTNLYPHYLKKKSLEDCKNSNQRI